VEPFANASNTLPAARAAHAAIRCARVMRLCIGSPPVPQ
jgi:hypothetical protein